MDESMRMSESGKTVIRNDGTIEFCNLVGDGQLIGSFEVIRMQQPAAKVERSNAPGGTKVVEDMMEVAHLGYEAGVRLRERFGVPA